MCLFIYLFKEPLAGAGSEVERSGHELAPARDASITGVGFSHYTTLLALSWNFDLTECKMIRDFLKQRMIRDILSFNSVSVLYFVFNIFGKKHTEFLIFLNWLRLFFLV